MVVVMVVVMVAIVVLVVANSRGTNYFIMCCLPIGNAKPIDWVGSPIECPIKWTHCLCGCLEIALKTQARQN
jgi:hypothetical protein